MDQKNFYEQDHARLAQAARIADWTWEGASVAELRGKIAELYTQVPIFSRQPFRAGAEENRYKDEIRREPLKITEDPTPVAAVSKAYGLIQHRHVLASVFRALRKIQIDISGTESTILSHSTVSVCNGAVTSRTWTSTLATGSLSSYESTP